MSFLKSKSKYDEFLPPPPPSTAEFDVRKGKPKFFDETIKPKKAETFPEQEEFSDLVKELEESKPEKSAGKKGILKKTLPKKQKITKKELKKIKSTKKAVKKQNVELPELNDDFDLKDNDLELPKEMNEKEIEFPDTLEELDIGSLGQNFQEKRKSSEILEAEEEIKNAIEKIKGWNAGEGSRSQSPEKSFFFNRWFAKKEIGQKPMEEHIMPKFPEVDNVSMIRNKINETRQALMDMDLETAKRSYIDIMRLYNRSKPEEQAKVYHDIKELYFERKSAMQLNA